MSDIVLSSGVRSNLLQLQQTATGTVDGLAKGRKRFQSPGVRGRPGKGMGAFHERAFVQ